VRLIPWTSRYPPCKKTFTRKALFSQVWPNYANSPPAYGCFLYRPNCNRAALSVLHCEAGRAGLLNTTSTRGTTCQWGPASSHDFEIKDFRVLNAGKKSGKPQWLAKDGDSGTLGEDHSHYLVGTAEVAGTSPAPWAARLGVRGTKTAAKCCRVSQGVAGLDIGWGTTLVTSRCNLLRLNRQARAVPGEAVKTCGCYACPDSYVVSAGFAAVSSGRG
jgi:hypothetical protein